MAKKNTRKKDVHHKIEVETNEKDSNFWDEKQNIEKEEVTMKEVVPTETTLSEKKKRKIKVSFKQQVAYFFLALSFVTTVCYFIYTVLTSSDLVNQMSTIIATGLLTFFSLFFIFTGLFADNKKGQSFLIVSSFLLTCFSGFQLGCEIGFIKVPTQKYVENFTNKNLTEVVAWASENNIALEQNYEYSDAIEPYHVISQNVDPGTLVKKVDTLQVTISDGPNYDKDFILPSMLGWNVDDVLTFIDENFLSNVTIDFEFSDSARDTIINQDVSGQMKRNAAIHFIASLGSEEELLPTDMKNLVGLSSFQATTWLKRNGLKFELLYEYSDTVRKGNVLNQSVSEGTTVDPKDASLVITLTISKGPKISVPNLLSMSVDEITAWVVENNLKINFTEVYDDTVELGKVVSASHKEGDAIEEGALVEITISKGPLKMGKFTTFAEFKAWADSYGIPYQQEQEFNDSVPSGQIIRISHQEGDIIKNNDTIQIVISMGASIEIPNFVGSSKSAIQKKCSSLGLSCKFTYGSFSDTVSKDIATKQSKRSGTTVGKGTSVTITLSKGPASRCTVFIQDTWMKAGEPSTTQSTLKSKLSAACPGVNFNIVLKDVNTGPGLITQDSPIKAGNNTFIEGNTYTIYVGK